MVQSKEIILITRHNIAAIPDRVSQIHRMSVHKLNELIEETFLCNKVLCGP